MAKNPNLLADAAVEAAMTRVLAAESAARGAVMQAREEATAFAEAARERARRIGLATERRIHAIRGAFAAKADVEAGALESEAAALGTIHVLTAAEEARVQQAVAALAAEMTGAPS